jgi:hypothetical protein
MAEQAEVIPTNVSKSLNLNPEESNSTASLTGKLPQKRFFRQRAHANPFSDHLLE